MQIRHSMQTCTSLYERIVSTGGVGLIPKPLAKRIAQMLSAGSMTDNALASKSSLAMVPEADEDEGE